MYKKIETLPTPIEKFKLPFEGQLAEDNRWVIMANLIPWSEFEDEYAKQFTMEMGAPAKSFRIAIGSLIIIYRTKDNRKWCKERGIRISGPPLGRPPTNVSQETKKQAQLDERDRNCIEGKFGEAKRRYSLDRMMTKLSNTSETAIAITFLVMNLSALLRRIIMTFFCIYFRKYYVFPIFRFG